MTVTEERWCAVCATEELFERFDCAEHPADCLELICTRCGHGLELAGPRPAPPTLLRGQGASPAPRRQVREVAA